MSERANQLKPLLDALTPDERDEIIAYLVDRTEADEELTQEEWETAWADEINRRLADFESGKTPGIPGDEVMQRLREKYG